MNTQLEKNMEYTILGQQIKLTNAQEEHEQALAAMEIVKKMAKSIKEKNFHLKNDEIAVLVALKLADEKLQLEKEFADNLDQIHFNARDILQDIDTLCSPPLS